MAAKYDFPAIIKGDTFKERKLVLTSNTLPMDVSGATVSFIITTEDRRRNIKEAPTSITNALGGEITLHSWDVNLPAFNYEYEFKITKADGSTLTYMVGDFAVLKSVK